MLRYIVSEKVSRKDTIQKNKDKIRMANSLNYSPFLMFNDDFTGLYGLLFTNDFIEINSVFQI